MILPNFMNYGNQFINAQSCFLNSSEPDAVHLPKFINPPSPVINSISRARGRRRPRKLSVSAWGRGNNVRAR